MTESPPPTQQEPTNAELAEFRQTALVEPIDRLKATFHSNGLTSYGDGRLDALRQVLLDFDATFGEVPS